MSASTASSDRPAADVVVVGAGPVGLVAACELARRGVAVRVVDKLTTPTEQSRAIAIHARSLEMFGRMGLADDLIASGVKATRMQMYSGRRQLAKIEFGRVASPYAFTVVTAQTETERILTGWLRTLGVTLDRGAELTGLTQDSSAVHLTISHDDGSRETADVAWVIGADGSRSTVRHLVGTRLEGSFEGERFVLGDVEAEHDLDRSSMYTYFSPDGLLAVFPMRDARMRLIAQVRDAAGRPLNPDPAQAELQQIVTERADGIRITRSHWLTEFEIHHAQVPAYRFGRVFLAGDAAHVHSPAGGQGMNTGMQDAFNLGWKLALAVRGHGGSQLLDTYQTERHPVGAKVIAFTSRLTTMGTMAGDVRTRLRDEIIHAALGIPPIRDAMVSKTEEVTVAYRHSPIALGPAGHHGGPGHHGAAAGDHMAYIADAAVQQQIAAAWGAGKPGHLILTIAPDRDAADRAAAVAAAPAGDAVHVLVTAGGERVPGYDAVIADPAGGAAAAFGLRHGGRVVVRPDGYIGLIASLDDDAAGYFARLTH